MEIRRSSFSGIPPKLTRGFALTESEQGKFLGPKHSQLIRCISPLVQFNRLSVYVNVYHFILIN